jgi:hypothetical protein
MIEVTITFRASRETVEQHGLSGAPVRLSDNRRFFIASEDMGDLIQLCKKQGWEIDAKPVFTSSLAQICGEVLENEWKEHAA